MKKRSRRRMHDKTGDQPRIQSFGRIAKQNPALGRKLDRVYGHESPGVALEAIKRRVTSLSCSAGGVLCPVNQA